MPSPFFNPLRRTLQGSGYAVPAIRGNAAITGVTWTDATDTSEMTANVAGDIYWAITDLGVTLTTDEIIDGDSDIKESGIVAAPQTGIYYAPYTSASGGHLEEKKLHYFIKPYSYAWLRSSITTHTITLYLVPSAFTANQWFLENEGEGTIALLDVIELPDDNSSPIITVEYRVNGGSWVELPEPSPGMYEITGLVEDEISSFELRCENENGWSEIGDLKSVLPHATDWTEFFFESWEADSGVTIATGQVQKWAGVQQGWELDKTVDGITFNATGSPNGGPCITFANSASMTGNMTGNNFPIENDDRTLISLIRTTDAWANFPSCPMYGVADTNNAFGISINGTGLPVFDRWGSSISGDTSMFDNAWRVIMISLRRGTARIFVSKEIESVLTMDMEAEQTGITLATGEGIFRLGRSLNNISRSPFEICATIMLDHGLSRTHRAQVLTYLNEKYLI